MEEFRSRLRQRKESYLLDVPSETLVRDLDRRVEQPQRQRGCEKKAPWENVEAWAARQPAESWQRFEVRAGEKGRSWWRR